MHESHILVVDDEAMNRELLHDLLECLGYRSTLAACGEEALQCLDETIDLILLDLNMPGMDGFETAARIRAHPQWGHLPIIMATVQSSREARLRAVESGANDFITKPIDRTELSVRVKSLLKMKLAQDRLRQHEAELEAEVERRTLALQEAMEFMAVSEKQAQEAHLDTVRRLALAAEFKDQNTAAHIHRVSAYCVLIGRLLHLSNTELEVLSHASAMHDVGKLAIPDAILTSPNRLTPEERQVMEQHTVLGAQLLRDSSSPLLQAGEIVALTHHEKWDGTGYPHELAGEQIPLYGRICAIADVFDALTTRRPYKAAYSNEEAIRLMEEGRGTHFDPSLLDLFLADMEEIVSIQKCFGTEY